jgi:hypothetical protein
LKIIGEITDVPSIKQISKVMIAYIEGEHKGEVGFAPKGKKDE